MEHAGTKNLRPNPPELCGKEFEKKNRTIKGGTYTAHIVVDIDFDNGTKDSMAFKTQGNLKSIYLHFPKNAENIAMFVMDTIFKDKARNMREKLQFKGKKNYQKAAKLKRELMRVYNDLCVNIANYIIKVSNFKGDDLRELIEDMLNVPLDPNGTLLLPLKRGWKQTRYSSEIDRALDSEDLDEYLNEVQEL